ncbi:MAG TPA: hypothetical protein PKD27_13395, partial [Tepidiformaceae bacterium]|nr:hypothetical protein [Tepidiformaceae bacterium]
MERLRRGKPPIARNPSGGRVPGPLPRSEQAVERSARLRMVDEFLRQKGLNVAWRKGLVQARAE